MSCLYCLYSSENKNAKIKKSCVLYRQFIFYIILLTFWFIFVFTCKFICKFMFSFFSLKYCIYGRLCPHSPNRGRVRFCAVMLLLQISFRSLLSSSPFPYPIPTHLLPLATPSLVFCRLILSLHPLPYLFSLSLASVPLPAPMLCPLPPPF